MLDIRTDGEQGSFSAVRLGWQGASSLVPMGSPIILAGGDSSFTTLRFVGETAIFPQQAFQHYLCVLY